MFLSEAVKSAKRPRSLHESKALNMGIAGFEPRQPSFVIFIHLFLYLTDESKCRFDCGVFSMLYIDHWEG
jgi:hypothetical protein